MPTKTAANGKNRAVVSPRRSAALPRALRKQAEQLLEMNVSYIDSDSFKTRNVEQKLFGFEKEPPLPLTSWYQPTRDEIPGVGTPQFMSPEEEKLMFLRYNYAKFKLAQKQNEVRKSGMTREAAGELVEWHRRSEHFREYLVRTNLSLVLAMSKRMRMGEADFAEIVSEGNIALVRAVEKFNVERGFKFSTYACRAILKAFSRIALKSNRRRTHFPVGFEPDFEKSDWSDRRREQIEAECIEELKAIIDRNLADLSDVEQTVIRTRFNLRAATDKRLTLDEVGDMIGLTKERVRQIQNKALAKIKTCMEDTVLRTRTATPSVATPA